MVWWPPITTYTFLDLRVTMCSTICCCRSLPHTQFIYFKTSLVLDEFIMRYLSLVINFFSGSFPIMQSCVLFVVNFSLTQTIYINLLCSLLCSLALYLLCTLVLCSLLHSFSPAPYIILYLYVFIFVPANIPFLQLWS